MVLFISSFKLALWHPHFYYLLRGELLSSKTRCLTKSGGTLRHFEIGLGNSRGLDNILDELLKLCCSILVIICEFENRVRHLFLIKVIENQFLECLISKLYFAFLRHEANWWRLLIQKLHQNFLSLWVCVRDYKLLFSYFLENPKHKDKEQKGFSKRLTVEIP
jgi:hypothetical protein